MGEVYAAYDPELDQRIAVELLRARGGSAEASAERQDAGSLRQAMAAFSPERHHGLNVGKCASRSSSPWNSSRATRSATGCRPRRAAAREVLDVYVAAGRGLVAAHTPPVWFTAT